jgi:DNA-nicking Smr family endonuclease
MDLHGLDLTTAWEEYRKATEECYQKKIKNLKVITGQGEMAKEFPGWVHADPFAISARNPENNKGSWTVQIKKHKKTENKPKKSAKPDKLNLEILYTKFKKIGE